MTSLVNLRAAAEKSSLSKAIIMLSSLERYTDLSIKSFYIEIRDNHNNYTNSGKYDAHGTILITVL